MLKVTLIGSNTVGADYEDALTSSGYSVSKFDSFEKALPVLHDKTDIILVDKKLNTSPLFKEFLKIDRKSVV
jgi:hypothetical protein